MSFSFSARGHAETARGTWPGAKGSGGRSLSARGNAEHRMAATTTASMDGGKPRLPKLRPNVNRKAQQIIAAHMRAVTTPTTSTATVPVLTKLEGTAPRMARTHDISHLADKPALLAPNIPETLIEECDHIYETSFMAKDSTSVYQEEDGLWHTKVFPSSQPSSRADAVMLDAWITRSLDRFQQEAAAKHSDFNKTVEDLVPLLSVSVHEIVRQVMHHCSERGLALDKIWKTYVELFNRVLKQMQESVKLQKERTSEVQALLQEASVEYKAQRKAHPLQMHQIISELEVRFSDRQRGFEEQLQAAELENSELKQTLKQLHRELEMWYPGFAQYQDTYIKNLIPQHKGGGALKKGKTGDFSQPRMNRQATEKLAAEDGTIVPEVALAEDFKRLLAVLAPEKRKLIGQDLAGLVAAQGNEKKGPSKFQEKMASSAEVDKAKGGEENVKEQQDNLQQLETLQAEVRAQEDEIRDLTEQIRYLEAQAMMAELHNDSEEEEKPDEDPSGAGILTARVQLLKQKSNVEGKKLKTAMEACAKSMEDDSD
eukprot:TRINITY_DN6878_c0_g6_i1.p1 TRINITY_DN6878_c0_g6~~TRINITY_DN6878_c0_g6_i1.p1  ORF type:complete len:542 (-),score=126.92 TRINITY_DN6878_c0_g6_i1:49-1674(-)